MTASNREPAGIYIHIPFCLRKCHYCAFLSGPADEAEREHYVTELLQEIRLRSGEIPEADTVYFGGGTPSLLTPEQIGRILREIRRNHVIAENAEITLEANPATLNGEKLRGYRELGVNRLSVGVQSMDDDRLRLLGRLHTREDVLREYAEARDAGFGNISMDLIFSIPGSTTEDALADLREVIRLAPEHLSWYSLQLEEGTDFFRDYEQGLLREVSDETDRRTYHEGIRLLRENGYEHYEISNFCRPGYRSRHNSKYWSMTPYAGFGIGASSFTGGRRFTNVSDMRQYAELLRRGVLPADETHVNTERDLRTEAVWTGLRRAEGVRFDEITGSKESFEAYFRDVWEDVLRFARNGDLVLTEDRIVLTEQGIDISNRIMALFV
ncbi:MAG: radical SAM family heme chaperone HemW [Mogibacterium sp.]|nr:radical SAM family heme chaperone HemW [Mogibacterium sp.]